MAKEACHVLNGNKLERAYDRGRVIYPESKNSIIPSLDIKIFPLMRCSLRTVKCSLRTVYYSYDFYDPYESANDTYPLLKYF